MNRFDKFDDYSEEPAPCSSTHKNEAIFADNTCSIGAEVYNLESRKPLLLPCSHSFCHICLQQLKSRSNELCPVCRESWAVKSVDSLPIIRQLVESSDKTKTVSNGQPNLNQIIYYYNVVLIVLQGLQSVKMH